MRVAIAFGSRGHAYSLSRYLNRKQLLSSAYTFCPRPLIEPELRRVCRTFPYLHLGMALLSRAGLPGVAKSLNLSSLDLFDRWVASVVRASDVFMAMSGIGLYARRAAREFGAFTVCDRGSTHIQFQDDILAEEYGLWGSSYEHIPGSLVEKETAEYAEADLVVAQSSFAYRSFLAAGFPQERLTWVSPGVSPDEFAPKSRTDDVFRVLFVGQLGLRKGIQYLIQAINLLKGSKMEFVFAGTMMPETSRLFAIAEGRFRYVGRPRTKEELRELYSQSSVFVLPSIEDGFGLVMTEAMACGVPVIASTNTGGPDVIEEGRDGFVIPIRSAEALADRISFLADRPALAAEMGNAALRKSANYSWDSYGARIARLYKERTQGR